MPIFSPKIKRSISTFFLILLVAAAASARAQVAPAAYRSQFTLTAGGFGSVFQPDYAGNGVPQTSPNRLYGFGAFVDAKFTRWIQIEGEARWLRINEFENIREDNYLIGPRVPIHTFRFMRATPYGKVLVGFASMNNNDFYGRFTDIAYGGGVDFKLTNRISARGDFEYQQWPNWLSNNTSLYPYGASVGVSYRILGGGRGLPRLTRKEQRQ